METTGLTLFSRYAKDMTALAREGKLNEIFGRVSV